MDIWHGPVTMSSVSHGILFSMSLLLALLNLLLQVSCVEKPVLSAPEGMLVEDKIRLGSTPPSCHNRCNACNPCTAVQVPTLPVQQAIRGRFYRVDPADQPSIDSSSSYKQYSNYKPLGWKCRCGSRLYNP